jgi:hypothetical protein
MTRSLVSSLALLATLVAIAALGVPLVAFVWSVVS